MTKNILKYEIDIPINIKNKHHKAEKPIELYKYLIENLTEEGSIILDQFGGSCNLLKASIDIDRYGVVFEKDKIFIDKAIERFKLNEYI